MLVFVVASLLEEDDLIDANFFHGFKVGAYLVWCANAASFVFAFGFVFLEVCPDVKFAGDVNAVFVKVREKDKERERETERVVANRRWDMGKGVILY